MRKIIIALVLVIGIFNIAGKNVSVQASAFEEDPGPMNEEKHS